MAGFSKGRADYLALGDYNAVCYECNRKHKASTMKRHWTGYWVCPEHWEPRHNQDFVRNVLDNQTPPWSQPMSDEFCYTCSPNGTTGVTDYATADCAVCEYISPLFDAGVP